MTLSCTEVRRDSRLVVRSLPRPPSGQRQPTVREERQRIALQQLQSEEAQTAVLAMLGSATTLQRIGCYSDAAHALHVALRLALRWRVAIAIGKLLPANAPITEMAGRLRSAGIVNREWMREVKKAAEIAAVVKRDQVRELSRMIRLILEGCKR